MSEENEKKTEESEGRVSDIDLKTMLTLVAGNRRERAVALGGEAFIQSLEKNGPAATLELLIKLLPTGDWLIEEFIYLFASTVTLSGFLKKIPAYTVTPEEFEHWAKSPQFLFGPKQEKKVKIEDGEIPKILEKAGKLMKEKEKKKKDLQIE